MQLQEHIFDFFNQIAAVNGVSSATSRFNVDPSVEQKLLEKERESSAFLQLINTELVDAQEGEKVSIDVSGPIAGRTDTSGSGVRLPRDVGSSAGDRYRCEQTDFDTFIKYSTMKAWMHRPEFQQLLRSAISKRITRDRLMIGFNGASIATTTDRTANPKLQDVNIGWFQQLRNHKASAVLAGAKVGEQANNDYKNLDAAVADAVNELIEEWHQDSGELVAIAGRHLIADKYVTMINDNKAPTEIEALNGLMVNKMLGGLKTITAPFVPAKSVMITPLSNLSIYIQRGTTEMRYQDNPSKNRIEEYRDLNECYVIEDYDACCLLDGILTWDAATSTWK